MVMQMRLYTRKWRLRCHTYRKDIKKAPVIYRDIGEEGTIASQEAGPAQPDDKSRCSARTETSGPFCAAMPNKGSRTFCADVSWQGSAVQL